MEMTDHQKRLWQSMIDLIQRYLNGETNDFYDLVGKLEGALDAADIKDQKLINEWYDFWTPLETRRVVEGNNIDKEKAIKELRIMKEFLLKKNKIVNPTIDLFELPEKSRQFYASASFFSSYSSGLM